VNSIRVTALGLNMIDFTKQFLQNKTQYLKKGLYFVFLIIKSILK
jgi:hypothetical protein